MKLPKIKPYLKKSKVYNNNESPIYISVTRNGKEVLISLGYTIPQEAWNKAEGRVYETKPKISALQKAALTEGESELLKEEYSKVIIPYNAKTINSEIENKIAELTLLQNKLRANEESLEVKNIKKKYTHNPELDRDKNFIKYGIELADRLFKNGNIGTYKAYKTVITKLRKYWESDMLSFSSIDVKFLSDYRIHLRNNGLKVSSIHNNFKTIKAIYYRAIKEEIIPQNKNPFKSFTIERAGHSRKEKLNVEEVKALEGLKLEKGSLLWHCRNYFIFSFNVAGIRIGDLIELKWENIIDGRLEYYMSKTGSFKSILLSKRNIEILKHYHHDNVNLNDYIFPLLRNDVNYSDELFLFNQISSKTTIVNKALKELARLAEIDKNLTTHIARHTFGDIARKKKVSLYDIKNMFAHDSLKTTEIYLASLDNESQDETMKEVLDLYE
jgi:site-specific recombinase XerD